MSIDAVSSEYNSYEDFDVDSQIGNLNGRETRILNASPFKMPEILGGEKCVSGNLSERQIEMCGTKFSHDFKPCMSRPSGDWKAEFDVDKEGKTSGRGELNVKDEEGNTKFQGWIEKDGDGNVTGHAEYEGHF